MDTSLFFFFRAVGTDNAEVGGFAVLGHGGNWDEKKRICARDNFTVSVGPTVTQASDFVCAQIYPFVAVGARAELAIFGSVSCIGVNGGTVEGAVVGIRVKRGNGSSISSRRWHFFIISGIAVGI
jgi:hypothetical protein